MRILGIDPGFATMGYGVIDTDRVKHKLIQYGTIVTQPKQPSAQRLRSIYLGVSQLMEIHEPDEVAFEELFFAKNVTTGMVVSAARGVAIVAVAQVTDEMYEYTPMQVKLAVTGYGKADKVQVQTMIKLLLNLNEVPKPDDAADAVAVAITHAHSQHAKEIYRMK